MIPNYESLIAGEMQFDAERNENGLPVQGFEAQPEAQPEGVQVAVGGGKAGKATLKEIMKSLKKMGRTRTDDILDRMEQPNDNIMSPQAITDLEALLTQKTNSSDELAGTVPINKTEASEAVQETPFFETKKLDNQQILEAMQNGETPTDKLTPQRSYNINRHHEGARAAINKTFEQMQSADEFARVLDFIAEETGKKSSRTFDEIRQAVKTPKDIFKELEPVFNKTQKGLLTDKQSYAARVLAASLFENMKQTARAINGGDDSAEALLKLSQTTEQLNFIVQYVSNNASETGRALSAHRMIAQTMKQGSLEDMGKLIESTGGVNDIKYQAKLIDTFVTQQEQTGENAATKFMGYMSRKIRSVTRPALEYWRAQILTSPKTHIVNLSGSALQNMWDNMLIRPTAATLGEGRKAINGLMGKETPDYVSYQEVLAANAASFTSAADAYRMMTRAFMQNDGRFTGTAKGAEENIGAFENVSKFLFGEKGGNAVSNVALASYRFLGAEDELGKALGYRQELGAQAIRQAVREGLTGKDIWKRAEELTNSPTQEMHAAAMEFAKRTTFQDEINGPILGGFVRNTKNMLHTVPELGFLIPFVETPTNIARRIVEISPLAPASSRIRQQFAAGGAQRDLANAKMLWGVGLAVIAWQMYDAELITGPGPEKWGVKDAKIKEGWQPNAVRIGNEFYSVDRLAPFGQALAAISAYRDQAKYAGSEEEFKEAFASMALIIANNVTEMPFMQGFSALMEGAQGEPLKVRRAAGGIPAGLVPYSSAVKDVKDLIDPVQRRVTEDNQAQNSFIEYAKQTMLTRLPGLSFNMRPARYWDGTVKVPQVGRVAYALSPFKIGSPEYERDKANVELIVQQVNVTEPKPIVAFMGVEFSLAELDSGRGQIYDAYIKKVGETRRELFDKVVNSEGYKNLKDDGPDSERQLLLLKAESNARKVALIEFIENDLKAWLDDSDSLSDIGKELNSSETIEAWADEVLATYGERREANPDYEDSVRLRGRARSLDPRDIKLNPLH